jgi:molecular chaperone GrpE
MKEDKELVVKPQGETGQEAEAGGAESVAPPGSQAPATAPAPVDLIEALEKLRAEKEQLYDRLVRKQAELENLRKRTQREKEEFRQYATEELIRALLPALDSFERALKHRDANLPEALFRGMEIIYRQLQEVLGQAGLVPIESEGKLFDPHLHQAIETVEAPERRDQEIVEELQRGYRLRHRLLRPAIVKVAVRPRKEEPSKPSEEKADRV